MYSDSLCFRNSSCSASFFLAYLAYVHCITFAVYSSFFLLDLHQLFLPGHIISVRSSFLQRIFLNLKKLLLLKIEALSKPLSPRHSAFKPPVEINNDKNCNSTKRSFLKVLENVCRIKKNT